MRIGFAYNLKPANANELGDEYAEFDTEETIADIRNAIAANGHEVIDIEADEDAYVRLRENRDRIDFVFNFSEGLRGESRESQIPIFCELLKIPYIGAGPLASATILDKPRTKEVLAYNGVPTPRYRVFSDASEKLGNLKFPLIAKPVAEGSSKGVSNDNLAHNEDELRKTLGRMLKAYGQSVLVEEFLDGREFTVSVIGNFIKNEKPVVLPIVEVNFDYLPAGMNKFDSFEAKWLYDSPEYVEKNNVRPITCPANVDRELEEAIRETALKAFHVTGCRDWARLDIRLDAAGVPNVIEINFPAGLLKDPKENSRMPAAAYASGWSFEQLVGNIINAGIKRLGL